MKLNQELTEAINKLIPEAGLMELKNGQNVIYRGKEHKVGVSWGDYPNSDITIFNQKELRKGVISGTWSDVQILGIELELRHILMALEVIEPAGRIAINSWGYFYQTSPTDGRYAGLKTPRYDLTKSLYNQTDELKQWLFNLLK